jgi:hypothetical protein
MNTQKIDQTFCQANVGVEKFPGLNILWGVFPHMKFCTDPLVEGSISPSGSHVIAGGLCGFEEPA